MTTTNPEPTCRSSMYADVGLHQGRGDREIRCGKPKGHAGNHAEFYEGDETATWLPKSAVDEYAAGSDLVLTITEEPGPSVSGQPTLTTVDLDAIRLRLDQLSQPVPQGAGALWQTRHDRDHAIGTARDLLAELARARSQLAEARERGDKLQADLDRKTESVAYYREMALERGKIMLASEAERDSLREEHTRLVAEVEKVRAACVREGRRAVAASSPITAAAWESRALELRRALAATAPPEAERDRLRDRLCETLDVAEVTDDQLARIVANTVASLRELRHDSKALSTKHVELREERDRLVAEMELLRGEVRILSRTAPPEAPAESINVITRHNSEDDNPPPVGEGGALIAATEAEIADMCDEWIGVNRLASQRDAWADTARILARALDGRPAAPVQPEERGNDWEPGDPIYDEQQRELIELATLRGEREWLTAKARDIGLSHVVIDAHGPAAAIVGEIGRLRSALATAEWERDAAIAERNARSSVLKDVIGQREQAYQARDRAEADRDALRAEVAEIADNLDKAEVGSVMTYGDARGIAATLRAALGSTPDTGSTT